MASKPDTLQALACVVKGKLINTQEEASACGILLNPQQGIILSHGSILTELCLKDKSFFLKVKSGNVLRPSDVSAYTFETLVDSRWAPCFLSAPSAPGVRESSYSLSEPKQSQVHSVSFITVKCKVLFTFRNEDFFKAVARIMPDSSWTFNTDPPEDEAFHSNSNSQQKVTDMDESNISFNLLSYFLVLKIEPVNLNSQNNKILSALKVPLLKNGNCNIGDVAEIVATPFGSQNPSVFFNTYSRGVVCNVSGPHGCWIVTDARCIAGSEGGPLFTGKENQTRYLTGIVAASLCWKNKEWVGFSLACSLSSMYRSLNFLMKTERLKLMPVSREWIDKQFINGRESKSWGKDETVIGQKSSILLSAALVKVGNTWGSGLIIDKEQGILLTCSHVVKDSHSFDIMVKPFQGYPQYRAEVIYRNSGSLQTPYDIAVLKCLAATDGYTSGVTNICVPRVGEKVYVVGHALFNTELDLQPSVCAGVISKVIAFQDQPVMLQSTCTVHPGSSGGPLLNSKGDLVGIVVCNTVDKGSNSSYPHINMSIPAVSIWPLVNHYLQTGDSSGFSAFEIQDPSVKKLWALDNSVLDYTAYSARSKL